MTQTDQEMTDEYADTIAAEVKLLEMLLDPAGYSVPVSSPEAQALREMLGEMAQNADEERDDYTPSVWDYIDAYGLEFTTQGQRSGSGDWEVTGHKILRTYGGPNCWIVDDGSPEYVAVEVYWGGSEARRAVRAPHLVSALGEIEL